MVVGIVFWIACIAIFRGRHNTWPWAIVKGTLLNVAIWAAIFLIVGSGEMGWTPW